MLSLSMRTGSWPPHIAAIPTGIYENKIERNTVILVRIGLVFWFGYFFFLSFFVVVAVVVDWKKGPCDQITYMRNETKRMRASDYGGMKRHTKIHEHICIFYKYTWCSVACHRRRRRKRCASTMSEMAESVRTICAYSFCIQSNCRGFVLNNKTWSSCETIKRNVHQFIVKVPFNFVRNFLRLFCWFFFVRKSM